MALENSEIAEDIRNLEDLPIGSHAAYLYDDSSEKQSIIFGFVSENLEKRSSFVLYVAGKQGVKGIRLSMKDQGVDVSGNERLKRLRIVDSEEWFLFSGKTSSIKSIEELQTLFVKSAEDAARTGNEYITVISEIDMLVRKGFFQNYLAFEKKLGRGPTRFKTIFVCAYDTRELKAAGILSPRETLREFHDTIIR